MKSRAKTIHSEFLACVIVFAVLLSLVSIGQAAEYPNRAIDIVVPHAPGGAVDSFFRVIQDPLAKRLKVPVSIDNRTGGGGVVGSSFVANAKPDGYTLLAQEYVTILMPEIIMPKTVPFHVLKDFTPIARAVEDVCVLVVRPNLECKTFDDLIAYAKKNPGKLVAGTSGFGALNRLALEILKSSAGIDIRNLSFSGGAEVITNLLGGHVDVGASLPFMGVISHIKAGKMRVLAITSADRIPDLPGIPTVKEKGFPELTLNGAHVLMGPKGLPSQITETLAQAVNDVLKSPEVRADLERRGYVISYLSLNQLSERMAKDFTFYSAIAKKAGLTQD